MSLEILGENYELIDRKTNVAIADSYVINQNKRSEFTGHGEAKLYVGNENIENRSFFGEKGFINKCFILKKDLIYYMNTAKEEYFNPIQSYKNQDSLKIFFNSRLNDIQNMDDILHFEIREQDQLSPPRIYINAIDSFSRQNYNIIREISLPIISHLNVLKLSKDNQIYYYYKLFIDNENASIIDQGQDPSLTTSRIGQSEFRRELLRLGNYCPFTGVKSPQLLIASHIKPWKMCENDFEKTDPYNGFMLTPTIDKLFDKGFITILENKRIKFSQFLPNSELNKIGLAEDKTYKEIPIEGREKYLDFHNKYIFNGI
ncbi:MAG: restriction endonuclease [Chloroflexi bacterium]|nr:restriction endonuclease [Chloroflexota bacterium]|tara:strand:+ start:3989 stop:4936 length:948 start_codon:yes stop_codon:yes gene_type:complete